MILTVFVDVLELEVNHLYHGENVYKKFKQQRESAFKQQQILESGTPEITLETTRTKPRNISSKLSSNQRSVSK